MWDFLTKYFVDSATNTVAANCRLMYLFTDNNCKAGFLAMWVDCVFERKQM